MKNFYSTIFSFALFSFAIEANAQCGSCTTTITGSDVANHIVTSGTLCITSTGSATGLITVSAGGTLCNQGTITSSNLWVAGGTFINYGVINTTNVLTSGQGDFTNYGLANIDSLLITNIYSTLNNLGTINNERLAVTDAANGSNYGTITTDFFGDSSASFTNNPSGSFTVNYDFGNAYNSGFFNSGYAKVSRDFYNSTGATFETFCMLAVGRDWYNSALILGPNTSCGGFNIAGGSYNSGTIGSASTHVDLCDAGHPTFGIDAPGGTIATTTTYCSCTNNCVVILGIKEAVLPGNISIKNIYPNPSVNDISIVIESKEKESLLIEVYDMMGRKQISSSLKANAGENKMNLEVSGLAQGAYILNITDEHQMSSKQMFNVVK